MLTAIRGDQIQMDQIHNGHIVGPTNAKFGSGLHHEKLYLDNSIVATFLNEDESVHQAVLDSRLIALWDVATSQSVSGSSIDVTTVVASTAETDTAIMGGTEKGVLTTGTGAQGAGTTNYRVQIRDSSSKDIVTDDLGGQVYGELTNDAIGTGVGNYTLSFKKSDDSAYTMAAAEVSTITTIADVSVEDVATGTDTPAYYHSLNGKYFRISSPTTDFYVWYNVSGENVIDPASSNVGRTGISVTVAPLADAATVAAGTATALSGNAAFTAASSLETLTVTNAGAGIPTEVLADGVGGLETSFGLQVTTPGAPTMIDFMFAEVYSYLTAPYQAFITGVGFADVVGVAGSHNHHDLYYTKVEVESGQLDNRYFTKSQLDSGQLDNRYYTESEIDPNPGTDTGDAKLDTRYYKESEIASTANGSSGALLVGVTPTGELASANVQSALVELQGDIDSILDGSADINFSMDDAYNDGSAVAVDDTDVNFQLTDSKSFVITADAGVTPILAVGADAAGDMVYINVPNGQGFGVTGDADFTGTFNSDGGAFSVDAGDTVDIDGTNVTIDGSAASSVKTTSAPLNIETVTSGTLTVKSAGALDLKDQFLGTALPLSQTGVTALSTNLDSGTSVVGAINENTDDLYTLINTTLPATTDASSGADQIGATGITGIIPDGGTLGGDGTVQAMLEGIAKGAAGGKVFPSLSGTVANGDPTNPGSLLDEKAAGMYFKANEIVYVKDINRFVMVKIGGTNIIEGTDWDYLWGANESMGGPAFFVDSDDIQFDTVGAFTVDVDGGVSLTDDSGAKIELTAAGTVDIDAAAGQIAAIYSDTEIELNGGALVDIDGTAITMDGQLTATGAADDNMVITTTGTGQVQLSAADAITLAGGDIDIDAGVGKTVTIDSDTEVAVTAPVVDIDAATELTVDAADIKTTGVLTQTGNAQIVGDLDLDGSFDQDGATFASDLTGDFTASAASALVTATTEIDLTAPVVDINGATSVDIDGAAINTTGVLTQVGNVDIDGTTIDIDGATTVTGATDDNFIVNTTGTGDVMINSEKSIDLNAPTSFFRGDVSVDAGHQLSVDKINITSVDNADLATITGQRTGVINATNLLVNPGFEAGSAGDADAWVEPGFGGRSDVERYFDNYSYAYSNSSEAGGATPVATQAVTGLNLTSHIVSMYFKGSTTSAIQIVANGSAPVEIVPALTTNVGWTRYNVDITPSTADGDFVVQVDTALGDNNAFFIDAMLLEEGTGAPNDFFSSEQSELIMRIGNNVDDKISFQSQADAGTIQELMAINNDSVRVFGDFIVDGTTTQINSEELTVADNSIIMNSNMTGVADSNMPDMLSEIIVERGDDANTSLRWNETDNKWELTNDGTNYGTIVTSSGSDTISMDVAYDGGSAVTVDDTNVDFALDAAKSFIVSDATDASKLAVNSGSGLDSVKIATTGGVDIDATAGVTIDGATVITGDTQVIGAIDLDGALTQDGASFASTVTGDFGVSSATVTVAATGLADVDADTLDVDATTAVTVDSAAIALAATAELDLSGDVVDIDGTTSVSIDGAAINTTGVLTQTGDTQIVGDLDLDGSFDQSGNYTFLVDTTATALDAVKVNSAGGFDIDVASTVAINATDITTTGALVQTGTAQIVGDMDLDGAIDHDGASFNSVVTGAFDVAAGGAASVTAEGITLEAGAGAFAIESDAASSVNVTGANLALGTTTSGTVALESAGAVTFDDDNQTNPINFSQTSADGFAVEFGYNSQTDFDWSVRETGVDAITSIMGALNSNRQDVYEYVELISTQGAAVGTAAGANLIGVDGITGVMPMDEGFNPTAAVGADATLQEILNGLATSAGGGKTFVNEAAFTASKAAGTYFKLNEQVIILDTNRKIIVLTADVNTVENTDWDYVHGAVRPMGDAEFFVNTTSEIDLQTVDFDVTTATFDVVASGAVLVDGESTITVDAADSLVLTSATIMDMDAVTYDIDGTTMDIDMLGAFTVDANAGSHINVTAAALDLSTQSSGDINITSAGNIVETATTKEENVTTFDVNASGAFTVDGAASSFVRTTGANLNLQTVGSGEIMFKDAGMGAGMALSDAANRALVKDADAAAIASIFDAINRAYNNTGDTSKKTYMEAPSLSSADVAAGVVQVSDEAGMFTGLADGTSDERVDLPGGPVNLSVVPGTLRGTYGIHLAVFLNGLRLSDSEWVYLYEFSTGRKMISFVNDHSTHPDFSWSTVNAADAITLSVTDHIVFDCTYNQSSNV